MKDYLHGLWQVLWGNPWLTPRGFAYVALLFAVICGLAAWRADRVYYRYLAYNPRNMYDVIRDDHKNTTEKKYRDMLEEQLIVKLRSALQWLILAFTLFAVQAHSMVRPTIWSSYRYWADSNTLELFPNSVEYTGYYRDLAFVFGVVAVTLTIIWVVTFTANSDEDPFKVRLMRWLAGLADPIQPNAPANRAQRVLARLGLSLYLHNKMKV